MYFAITDHTKKGIDIYDAESMQVQGTLRGHSSEIACFAWAADIDRLASAALDWVVKVWDVESMTELASLLGGAVPQYLDLAANGDRVLLVDMGTNLTCWEVSSRNRLAVIYVGTGVATEAYYLDTGNKIISMNNKELTVWESSSGVKVSSFSDDFEKVLINGIALSPDERFIAAARKDSAVAIYTIEDGKLLRSFVGHTNEAYAVSFSADGKRLGSGSQDKTAIIWDVETGAMLEIMQCDNPIIDISVNYDGTRIACRTESEVILFDVSTQESIVELPSSSQGLFSKPRVILM
jgi:WD40 repeat protein